MGRRENNEEEGEGLRRGSRRRKWGGVEDRKKTPPPKLILWLCLQQLASCLCEIWILRLTYLKIAVQSCAPGERKRLPEKADWWWLWGCVW